MTLQRRTKRLAFKFAAGLLALCTVLGQTAQSAVARSVASWLGLALVVAILYMAKRDPSDATERGDDDVESDVRASAFTRAAWAAWMSVAGAMCLGLSLAIGTSLPQLAEPLRGLGFFLFLVAAYKLFFGRRSGSTDLDG